MRRAAAAHQRGALFVVGCAPTALEALIELSLDGALAPAFVIGTPVGFVGAADAKEALRATAIPAASNRGDKGGSAVAAAVLNALVRAAHEEAGRA